VVAVPTVLVFVNGKVVEHHRGFASKAFLAGLLEAHLAADRSTA
jgi:hypothetical protein